MTRSLTSGFLSILSARVVLLLLGIVFTPMLVRFLGPNLYGKYAAILSVFAFANFLMSSGTNDAVRKFISERDEYEWQHAVFGMLGKIAAVLALIIAIVFIFVARFGIVELIFGPEYIMLFYLLAFYAVGRQVREFFLRTLMGLNLETSSEPLRILQRTIFVLLALSAAYLGYGVEGVLLADIFTSIILGVILIYVLSNHIRFKDVISSQHTQIPRKQIMTYTAETILFFGFLMSLYHIDILVLQYYESDRIVGYYKGALVIAQTLWIVPSALQLSLLQRVSDLWQSEEISKIKNKAALSTRFSLLFTMLTVIGMATLARYVVPIYLGSDFKASVAPLLYLLPGVLGFAVARPTLAINQARRSLRPLIAVTAISAIINLILNLLFIPQFGMKGAAISTSIGYGSIVLFQGIVANSFGYSPFQGLHIGRVIVTGAITGIVIFPLSSILQPIVALLIIPLIGLILYSVVAISVGAITMHDLNQLTHKIPEKYEEITNRIIKFIPKIN